MKILSNFDDINGSKEPSDRHSKCSTVKDLKILLKQLHVDSCVLVKVPGRSHRCFPKFEANPMQLLSIPKLVEWMGQ